MDKRMHLNITLHFSIKAKQYTTCYTHKVRGCAYVGKSYDVKYPRTREIHDNGVGRRDLYCVGKYPASKTF